MHKEVVVLPIEARKRKREITIVDWKSDDGYHHKRKMKLVKRFKQD
jgi:hypothetical protein